MFSICVKARITLVAGLIVWPSLMSGWSGSGKQAISELDLSLQAREQRLWRVPVREAQFVDVPHTAINRCERTRAPEALTTPNPLLETASSDLRIRVSFIIGTDGKVHSPLILESMGQIEDRTVLDTMRSWRYRPGMCNGVPTEIEGKVEFSSR